MPSINYYNRSAPFWDWIASMEEQGGSHPLFGNTNDDHTSADGQPPAGPWPQMWAGFPFGPHPHRHGRPGQAPHAPHAAAAEAPPADETEQATNEKEGEAGPSEPQAPENEPAGPSHRGRGGPWRSDCRRGRGWGGRGRGHHFGGPAPPPPGFPPMAGLFGEGANFFREQLFGNQANSNNNNEDFKPEIDVFDTPEAFVVHVSLPGAKKEDVGVNWDAEKSELAVAGVIYRPGDEEFLKTLAMDERKVGAFERKVRLGSRANPAQVDVDGITARMQDGVLTVEVPKLDAGFVEIKKVDIE